MSYYIDYLEEELILEHAVLAVAQQHPSDDALKELGQYAISTCFVFEKTKQGHRWWQDHFVAQSAYINKRIMDSLAEKKAKEKLELDYQDAFEKAITKLYGHETDKDCREYLNVGISYDVFKMFKGYDMDGKIADLRGVIESRLEDTEFFEGDYYYTFSGGEIIWSIWDEQSDLAHIADPSKEYYSSVAELIDALNLEGTVKVYDSYNVDYKINIKIDR